MEDGMELINILEKLFRQSIEEQKTLYGILCEEKEVLLASDVEKIRETSLQKESQINVLNKIESLKARVYEAFEQEKPLDEISKAAIRPFSVWITLIPENHRSLFQHLFGEYVEIVEKNIQLNQQNSEYVEKSLQNIFKIKKDMNRLSQSDSPNLYGKKGSMITSEPKRGGRFMDKEFG
jgi:flagellar biosynthesis/type III secretory pathway chaperone